MDYTIKRNTIYTLDVQVQSIESGGSLNANLEIHDWDDAVIDIDAPWGEAATSHSALYVLPGEGSTVMTVAAGGGTEPFSVTLMKPDRSGTLDASWRRSTATALSLRATPSCWSLRPKRRCSSRPRSSSPGAWLKIVKTKGDNPPGWRVIFPWARLNFRPQTGVRPMQAEISPRRSSAGPLCPTARPEPLEWTAETVDAGGASAPVPDWLTIQTSTTGNLSAAWRRRKNSHRMQTEAAVVNYDLSTRDGLMNTANCYLVHAAGYLLLPLVYGNAIKDGATNAAAYTFDGQRDEHPESLFNHSRVQFHQSLIFPITASRSRMPNCCGRT